VNPKMKARYEARARIIKAMAHPSRLFIVEELQKRERCVNELTEMIGADASTESKHLSVLKNAGLVADEKRGTAIYYTLRTPCILNFIGCVEEVLEANVEKQLEIVRSYRAK
jgi:ArsR family transcriptional regulator